MMKSFSGSPTSSSASSRRRYRSERQSLASSLAARVRLPFFSSLPSKRSKSVKASAVPPANPASTFSPNSRRTLRALPFMTVLPRVTWPSPPMATAPLRRTPRIVVPWGLKTAGSLISVRRGGDPQAADRQLNSSLAACPRVCSVVDAGEVLEVKMSVDLRRRDVGVPQQLLDATQLPARFEQVGGEGMPEEVRMHVHAQALALRPVVDARLDGAGTQALTPSADEKRRIPGRRQSRALLEPGSQRRERQPADRHDAGFPALAEHPHGAVLQVDVGLV